MKVKKHKSNVNISKVKKPGVHLRAIDKLADFLEIPEELMGDNIKVTLIDNKYLYLEGKNQIMDYYDHYIKVKTNKRHIIVEGQKMEIKEITDKELMIEGKIQAVSYNN